MEYENKEWEMNFKDMFFFALFKWKRIIAISLVLALIFGGFQFVRSFQKSKYPGKSDLEYAEEMEKYSRDLEILESSIEDTNQMIDEQKNYLLESTLMQLGPHNTYEAKADLYIATDYKIMPNMVYQNVDYIESIMAIYKSMLKNNDIVSDIADSMDMDGKYLKELISVSASTGHVLEISVLHKESEIAERILDLLMEKIESTKQTVTLVIGQHRIEVVLRTAGPYVDGDVLSDKREKQEKVLSGYEEDLEELEKELNKLKGSAPVKKEQVNPLKKGVIWAAIGCAVGAVLCAVAYCVIFVFRTWVYSADELSARIGIKCLGSILSEQKRIDRISRRIKKLEGRITENSQENIALIAQTVANYSADIKQVLVVGSGERAWNDYLVKRIQPEIPDIKLTASGSLLRDADAVTSLRQCDAVLLVESCGKTKYKTIGLERERIEDAGKKLLGCVLIDI